MGRVTNRLQHAWNMFQADENKPSGPGASGYYGGSFGMRPHSRTGPMLGNKKFVDAIYSRIAVDVSSIELKHVKTDATGKYETDVNSNLNECLTVRPNLDQGPRQFMQDYAMTLFREGQAAIVPVETADLPGYAGGFDPTQLRVGSVVDWRPRDVVVSVYDDRPDRGERREVTVPKHMVAIVENPFYETMNSPNSVLQRLLRKLHLLDIQDEDAASKKLNLLIQFPFQTKSEQKRRLAEQRVRDIELQLMGSEFGIAYADAADKITQLNRPIDSSLMGQITYLWGELYNQLGLTPEIMNGTASATVMTNYYSRTINPIVDALAEELYSKFLTKNARTRGQKIMYFRNPFGLISLPELADIADVFSRNEILSPNELRTYMGMRPSSDPQADQLKNSNMPEETGAPPAAAPTDDTKPEESGGGSDEINQSLDGLEKDLDSMFEEFDVDDS